MKKYYLLLLSLLSASAFSQNVNIPDPVFKSYLLAEFDDNASGEIEVTEAQSITIIWLGNLAVSDLTGIEEMHLVSLNIVGSNLTQVDVSGLPFLESMGLSGNLLLESVNASNCPVLQGVNLTWDEDQNPVACSIDISGSAAITTTNFINGNIQYINAAGCLGLTSFSYHKPSLQGLDLSGCANIDSFYCMGCTGFDSFDFSVLPNLSYIDVRDCGLTSLTFGLGVGYLDCRNNQLTSLDFSGCYNGVQNINAIGNQIQYLNFKNGNLDDLGWSNFQGNPLVYVCIDEEMDYVGMLYEQIPTPFVVNSYCDFVPGGLFNTMSGNLRYDLDNDGCDDADETLANYKLKVTGAAEADVFTNESGLYSTYLYGGNFTIAPVFENPSYFTVSPTSVELSLQANGQQQIAQDFCVSANGANPDLEVVIVPMTFLVPGFDVTYSIIYRNKGNQVLSGNLAFSYDEPHFDFVSSEPVTFVANNGLLNWNYSGLQPFETRTISVVLNVNSPMETPAVNIDDEFGFAAAGTITADAQPQDNYFQLQQEVVGSFDPNDKTCLEGDVVSAQKIGDYLHYLIRFENTGNFPAQNIVVKDIIDTGQYDIASLQVLDNSHEVHIRIGGNVLEFVFENIQLGPEAKGFVLFKIKTLPDLSVGSTVANFADIFFDYNFPITTNEAETTFQDLSVGGVRDISISFFPNPVAEQFTVKGDSEIKSVQLFDTTGRLLETHIGNFREILVDLYGKPSGIYFVKAVSEKGTSVQKIIKK